MKTENTNPQMNQEKPTSTSMAHNDPDHEAATSMDDIGSAEMEAFNRETPSDVGHDDNQTRQEAALNEKHAESSSQIALQSGAIASQDKATQIFPAFREKGQAIENAAPQPTDDSDEPMLFKKEVIRKHKPYYPVRGGLLVVLLFLLSAGTTALTWITIERLYTNLSPFLGVYFGAFAVVALLHILINVNRLPYWGFTIFPIAVIGLVGVILLAFEQSIDNIFYMYVIIGVWGVAMLAFVHSMLLKGLMPIGWLFLTIPSILVVAASVFFAFYPFVLSYGDAIGIIYDAVSAITPLMITRGLFIAISVVMFIDAVIWFIVRIQEKDRLGLTGANRKNKQTNTKDQKDSKEDNNMSIQGQRDLQANDHEPSQKEAPDASSAQ